MTLLFLEDGKRYNLDQMLYFQELFEFDEWFYRIHFMNGEQEEIITQSDIEEFEGILHVLPSKSLKGKN